MLASHGHHIHSHVTNGLYYVITHTARYHRSPSSSKKNNGNGRYVTQEWVTRRRSSNSTSRHTEPAPRSSSQYATTLASVYRTTQHQAWYRNTPSHNTPSLMSRCGAAIQECTPAAFSSSYHQVTPNSHHVIITFRNKNSRHSQVWEVTAGRAAFHAPSS